MNVRHLLACVIVAILIVGCAGKSREALTGKAVGCSTHSVDILPSEFDRKGMDTSWCAKCKDKRYQCVTNAERTRTVCNASKDGDGCD